MKHLPACSVFFLALTVWVSGAHAGSIGKFTFERNSGIWVANLDGSGAKELIAGRSPDLSPDGTKLVYETIPPDDKPVPPHLIVLDLASGKSTTLDTQGQDITDPLWSPDGAQIVLTSIDSSGHAHIGITRANGENYHLVASTSPAQDYWDANWAADGHSLFAQDFKNIYQLDLYGRVLKKWVIATLIPNGEMSRLCHLNPSPDGKTLLMDVDEKGPPAAVYLMNLATEKATRLTPDKFHAWSCRWMKAPDCFFYVSQIPGDHAAIYATSVTGRYFKLIARKASFPSAAR